VGALGERLRGTLAGLGGVHVHDGGQRRSGIVTFTMDAATPARVKQAALATGINVSVSESHFARLDMAAPNPEAVVRASPHYYNTDEELDRLVDVVATLAGD
jgi:selenocysteine lyase/cysteine desulfurase